MSRTDPQFNLRIPAELRDKVMAAAQENKRSATAEIIARLEVSFEPGGNHEHQPGNEWDEVKRLMESVESHLRSLDAKGGPEYFAALERKEKELEETVITAPKRITRSRNKK